MNKTVLLIGLLSATAHAEPLEMNDPTGAQEIHTVRRYQFDATHMLVKTTDTEHCGVVPKSAFK